MKIKSLIVASILIATAGVLFAATKQPIANGPSVMTSAEINAATPAHAGQLVVCSNCNLANTQKYNLCISTVGQAATSVGGFILISSATAITACR